MERYRAKIEGAFGKQALQVVWDFAEANPFSNGSANWNNALDWVVEVLEANVVLGGSGTVERAAAQDQILPMVPLISWQLTRPISLRFPIRICPMYFTFGKESF